MDQVLLFPGYDFRFTPDMEELCEILHPKLDMDQLLETLHPSTREWPEFVLNPKHSTLNLSRDFEERAELLMDKGRRIYPQNLEVNNTAPIISNSRFGHKKPLMTLNFRSLPNAASHMRNMRNIIPSHSHSSREHRR
jgi:hypothetical protein